MCWYSRNCYIFCHLICWSTRHIHKRLWTIFHFWTMNKIIVVQVKKCKHIAGRYETITWFLFPPLRRAASEVENKAGCVFPWQWPAVDPRWCKSNHAANNRPGISVASRNENSLLSWPWVFFLIPGDSAQLRTFLWGQWPREVRNSWVQLSATISLICSLLQCGLNKQTKKHSACSPCACNSQKTKKKLTRLVNPSDGCLEEKRNFPAQTFQFTERFLSQQIWWQLQKPW